MAGLIPVAEKNAMLDNRIPATVWVQLHDGDPTSAGTANVSQVNTRRSVAMSAGASGEKVNSGTATWSSITITSPTPDGVSHYTAWDAETDGVLKGYGSLTTARTGLVTGDSINLAAGEVKFRLPDPA